MNIDQKQQMKKKIILMKKAITLFSTYILKIEFISECKIMNINELFINIQTDRKLFYV
jgi:hypothetical protein